MLHNPVQPGDILQEEFLTDLCLSAETLAKAVHTPLTRIENLAQKETRVTSDMAARLSQYLGTSPEFWLNLQCNYERESVAS